MDTINYTEQEKKQIGLLKAWVKLSKVGGNFGKQATETFTKDWIKLQEDFVDRLGLLGGRVYINKTMNLIENYIKLEEVEEDLDICGETGREFDRDNSVKGCGKKITEDDENIMIGNISYCCECGEKGVKEEEEQKICSLCEGIIGGDDADIDCNCGNEEDE